MGSPWGECVDKGVATLKCIPVVFSNLINAALTFAGVVGVILVIVAGYKYLTSGGDAKKLEGAQKTLTYAVIGIILVVLSFLIINFISLVTGVTCIKNFEIGACIDKTAGTAEKDKDKNKNKDKDKDKDKGKNDGGRKDNKGGKNGKN